MLRRMLRVPARRIPPTLSDALLRCLRVARCDFEQRHDADGAGALLASSLVLHDVDVSVVSAGFFTNLIRASVLEESESRELQDCLRDNLSAVNLNARTPDTMIALWSVLTRACFFELANECRKKAAESFCWTLQGASRTSFRDALTEFALCVEAGDIDEVRSRAKSLSRHWLRELPPFYAKVIDIVGQEEASEARGREPTGTTRDAYRNFLAGKTVAVVAPGYTDAMTGSDIDGHDVVVRLNALLHDDFFHEEEVMGRRTDVVYLAGSLLDTFFADLDSLPMDAGIRWLVGNPSVSREALRRLSTDRQAYGRGRPSQQNVDVRSLDPNPLLFNGKLNLLPRVVVDLLAHGPELVTVYHADLRLTYDTRYSRFCGPNPNEARDSCGVPAVAASNLRDIATNDQVSQLGLFQFIRKSGRLKGDAMFSRTMDMTADEYASQMQSVYSPFRPSILGAPTG